MRKVFDFNIHLPYVENEDVNIVVENDLSLTERGLLKGLEAHSTSFSGLNGANFLLFNTDVFSNPLNTFITEAKRKLTHISLTALIDFRREDIEDYLDLIVQQGGMAIMVNSYLQKIEEADFDLVLAVCRHAEQKGLAICIDGSYGTSKMFTYDNMKLACYIGDHIHNTPIVIIHSGGLRVMQAMLLALDKSNIWLETSFSLSYYLGSSLETDFAFVYKKMNCERVIFGSDIPYLNSDVAISVHDDFFQKYGFSDQQVERILYNNAMELMRF